MKKYLWILLALGLIGCGDENPISSASNPEEGGGKKKEEKPQNNAPVTNPNLTVSQDISGKWLLIDSSIEGIPYNKPENMSKTLHFCENQPSKTVQEYKAALCEECNKRIEIYDKASGKFKVLQKDTGRISEGTYSVGSGPIPLSLHADWIPGNVWNFNYIIIEERSDGKVIRKMFSRGSDDCMNNAAWTGANKETGQKHNVFWVFKYCGDLNSECQ
jgi:hypothetical protein